MKQLEGKQINKIKEQSLKEFFNQLARQWGMRWQSKKKKKIECFPELEQTDLQFSTIVH